MTEYTNFEKAQSYAQLAEHVPDDQPELRHSTLAMAQVFATLAQIEAQRDAVSAVDHMTQTVETGDGNHGDPQGRPVVLRQVAHQDETYPEFWDVAYIKTDWETVARAKDVFPENDYVAARFEIL